MDRRSSRGLALIDEWTQLKAEATPAPPPSVESGSPSPEPPTAC
jgi:hypothetical protein